MHTRAPHLFEDLRLEVGWELGVDGEDEHGRHALTQVVQALLKWDGGWGVGVGGWGGERHQSASAAGPYGDLPLIQIHSNSQDGAFEF
jgi:hypothetical protein